MTERHPGSDVLAIDIGGTKVALGLVGRDGRLLRKAVAPTPRGAPRDAVATILARAAELLAGESVAACGVALPAVVEDGVVAWAAEGISGWDGLQLRAIIEDALGVPTAVEFDGYAATLGEVTFGAGRGLRDVAVVIVGTGVGAGFVSGGRLVRGAIGVAGALGWLRFPTDDGLSVPLEDAAAGPGILAAARAGRPDGASIYPDAPAVFDAAAAGDPVARLAVDRAMRALAAGVVAVVALLAPELIVLGGSVGARPDVVAVVREFVLATTQPHAVRAIRIEPSALGSLSSLYGAAHLALSIHQERE